MNQENKKPNVVIAIPGGEMMHTGFALSLASLDRSVNYVIINGQSCNLPELRQDLALEAMKEFPPHGPDYLLFLDTDMMFPPNIISRLVAHGKDIAGAAYRRRGGSFDLMGVRLDGTNLRNVDGEERLIEVMRLPTGLMLIDMKVFKALPKPFFNYNIDEQGKFSTEDYWFCDAARAHGFKIWCDLDLSLECGHVGQIVFRGGHNPAILKLVLW